jgi:hypothetical protein
MDFHALFVGMIFVILCIENIIYFSDIKILKVA